MALYKDNHPQEMYSVIESQSSKADMWYKCCKFAVRMKWKLFQQIIFINYDLYLIALTCSLILRFINKLQFKIYLRFLM